MLPPRLRAFFTHAGRGPAAPARIFWVALVVRLLYMTLAHTYRFKPLDGHFYFGFEAGRIGQALANGYGFADPFANVAIPHTGPTAWLPPLYPLLVAAAFKLFGVYTNAAAWALLALNCVFSALTASFTWELGYRFNGSKTARWSGWLWALYPAAMQYAVRWVWEMSLTTALFLGIVILVLRMADKPEQNILAGWSLFGLLWALIALSNSTVLLMLPVTALWLLWQTKKSGLSHGSPLRHGFTKPLIGATLSAVIFCAVIAPWILRNQRVFHTFIPLRGNFGAELYLGNGPYANGLLMEHNHPMKAPDQLRLYRDLGEVAYVHQRGAEARAIIAADPGLFARNTLKRVDYFWFGVAHPIDGKPWIEFFRNLDYAFITVAGLLGLALALHRRKTLAGLFAWACLLIPLLYYPVTAHARFRHPLEPLLCVLGVYLFQSAEPRYRSPDQAPDAQNEPALQT